MRKILFTLLLTVSITSFAISQSHLDHSPCATAGEYPEWLAAYLENPAHQNARSADDLLMLPITFKSVGNSEGEGHYPTLKIFESLCRLNKDFEPYNIQFYLKGAIEKINRDLYYDHDNFSDGFKMMQSNKDPLTINVFITNDAPSNACGYFHPSADAIVVIKNCMGGSGHTLTHEVGHWLSLPHTFAGWEGMNYDPGEETPLFLDVNGNDTIFVEGANGENCDRAGDRFCDTPADYLSIGWNCSGNKESLQVLKDPFGNDFRSDGTNYMSYSSDACQSKFSVMQVDAMRAYIDFARSHYVFSGFQLGDVNTDPMSSVYPQPSDKVHYQGIELEWNHHPNATRYLVQISRFSFFAAIDYEFIVSGNTVNIGDLTVDKNWYWRVKPYNDFDLCGDFTDFGGFQTFDITDVEEISPNNGVNIYPNLVARNQPINMVFEFNEILPTKVQLYNIGGQVLQDFDIPNPGRQTIQIESGNLARGMYILRLSTAKGQLTKRLTVQ